MEPGDKITTSKPIRSQIIGIVLPKEATFVRVTENMGRMMVLAKFVLSEGKTHNEYIFPDEIVQEVI